MVMKSSLCGVVGLFIAAEVLAAPLPNPVTQVEMLAEIALITNDCPDWVSNGTSFVRKDCTLVLSDAAKAVIEGFLNDPEQRATRALRDIAKCPEYTENGTALYRRACVKAQTERAGEDVRDFKDDQHPISMGSHQLSNPQIAALISATAAIQNLPDYSINGHRYYRVEHLAAAVNVPLRAYQAFVKDSVEYERQLNAALDCPRSVVSSVSYQQRGCVDLLVQVTVEELAELGDLPVIKAVKAGEIETLLALLALGQSPDSKDFFGNTALTVAIADENEKIVRILLEAKANPSLEDGKKRAPIEIALLMKNAAIARMLKKSGADLARVDAQGNSVLLQAMTQGMWEFAHSVVSKQTAVLANKAGENPLYLSIVKFGNREMALDLLDAGASADSKTPATDPLLVWSLGTGVTNRAWFDLLLGAGANVNLGGPAYTPITIAISADKSELLSA
ncbi:MAG: ankyrin repeat domain-containing protein, partial [Bdellovibrionota bacterium]